MAASSDFRNIIFHEAADTIVLGIVLEHGTAGAIILFGLKREEV